MELNLGLVLAVIAHHCHHVVLVLIWHGCCSDLHIDLSLKSQRIHYRLLTEGAHDIGLSVLLIAFIMHRVPTAQHQCREGRSVYIGEADWTVDFEGILNALMVRLVGDGIAHLALFTVVKIFSPAGSAYATALTMENFFCKLETIAIEHTDSTVVASKNLVTFLAFT